MSSGGAFDLGSYGAELTLDSSQFEQGMSNAEAQINNTENKAKGFGSNLGIIAGGAIAGFGAALVGAAVAGVKMSDDLHKALNGLQSSTGATDDQMKGMEQSLKNIYNANFGQSFDDIAQSMATVKQNTGLTGQALEDATKNALLLRDTFEMDVNETTNTANSLMKQFGITSEQAYNLIAQGAQNGANKNGDLLDSLNEYAPQFQAMGFSAEQFTNVLIDGAKNGQFSIDKVGDSMKEFNIRSKDLSQTSLDAFKSLGLNGQQMSQSFAKGGESAQKAFQQVMTSLNNVKDPVEKNRIGIELFGTQFEDLQAKGILALGNIGKTASTTKDTLGEINKVKYNTFGEALEGIKRNFQTALIDPMEKNVLPAMSDFSNWIVQHMPEIQKGIKMALDDATKVFNGLKDAVKFVTDNMNILLPVIGSVTGAIAAQAIINVVVDLYKAWKLATTAQTTAQWLLNAAMDANPIGLVALAIGGLIAAGIALYQNWDTVKDKMDVIWMRIKAGAQDAINGVIDKINDLIRLIDKIPGVKVPLIPKVNLDVLSSIRATNAPKGYGSAGGAQRAYASGTSYHPGGIALVGEEGPELVDLPIGSKVYTNSQTKEMLNGVTPLIGQKIDPFADALFNRLWKNLNDNRQTNPQLATASGNSYSVNIAKVEVTGDENGAKQLLSSFVTGVKRLGGKI
jgi:TP901 family phage tail tape measure protein